MKTIQDFKNEQSAKKNAELKQRLGNWSKLIKN